MSFLSALQDAAQILSIAKPIAVATTDPTAIKLIAIAHQAGDDIARRADWSDMLSTASVTNGVVPADFLRLVPGGAVNIVTPSPAPVRGPLSSDQILSIGRLGATTALYYAMQGGAIIFNRPLAGETVSMSYVSLNWLSESASRTQRTETGSEITLFPERLLVKAIIWRFKRSVGLQYQDEMAEFEADLALEIRQNRGVTT